MSVVERCRYVGDHDWAYGTLAMWCLKCWLVKPYKEMRKKGTPKMLVIEPKRAERKSAHRPSVLHAKPWAEAEKQPECHYCGFDFHAGNPPTFDHIVPVSHGGTMGDGWVLACTLCNQARANYPYDEYLTASIVEMSAALAEHRSYRRPKCITNEDGTQYLTTATKAERRAAKRETRD
jgi:5-methylcytosine-specific restriction endonuclease McrA